MLCHSKQQRRRCVDAISTILSIDDLEKIERILVHAGAGEEFRQHQARFREAVEELAASHVRDERPPIGSKEERDALKRVFAALRIVSKNARELRESIQQFEHVVGYSRGEFDVINGCLVELLDLADKSKMQPSRGGRPRDWRHDSLIIGLMSAFGWATGRDPGYTEEDSHPTRIFSGPFVSMTAIVEGAVARARNEPPLTNTQLGERIKELRRNKKYFPAGWTTRENRTPKMRRKRR